MAADRESDFELSPLLDKLAEEYANEPRSRKFLPLAEEYRKSKMYEEAIFFLSEGLKNHPNFLPAKLTLARCYIESKQYEDAKNICLGVISDFPENLSFLRSLAESYFGLNDKERARDYYTKILALNPDDMLSQRKINEIDEELRSKGGSAASMSTMVEEIDEETARRAQPIEPIPETSDLVSTTESPAPPPETDQTEPSAIEDIILGGKEEKPDSDEEVHEDLILEEPDELGESLAGFSADEIIEPTHEEVSLVEKPVLEETAEAPDQKTPEEVVFEPEGFASTDDEELKLDLDEEDNIFDTEDSPDFGHHEEILDQAILADEATSTARRKPLVELDLDIDDEVIEEVSDLDLTLGKDTEESFAPEMDLDYVAEIPSAESEAEVEDSIGEAEEIAEELVDQVAEEASEVEGEKAIEEDLAAADLSESREQELPTGEEDIEIVAPGGKPLEFEDLSKDQQLDSTDQVIDLTPDFMISDETPEDVEEELDLTGLLVEESETVESEAAEELVKDEEKPSEPSRDVEAIQEEARIILEESVFDDMDLGAIDDLQEDETASADEVEDLTLRDEIKDIELSLADKTEAETEIAENESPETDEFADLHIPEDKIGDDESAVEDFVEPPEAVSETADDLEDLHLEEFKVEKEQPSEVQMDKEDLLDEEIIETIPFLDEEKESGADDFSFIDEDQEIVKMPSLDTDDELIPAGTVHEQPPRIIQEKENGTEEAIPVTMTSAKIYEEQGHFEEALRIYKKLLEREPYFKNIAERIVNLEKRMALARIPTTRKYSEVEVSTLEKWLNNIKSFKKHVKNWSID